MTTSRKPTRAKQLGVSDDEYARLLKAQGGGCAICGTKPKTRRLHVDHDHKTGEVRGLLCHRCNRVLQSWVTADWLLKASGYLRSGRSEVAANERRPVTATLWAHRVKTHRAGK
jgi:hypothetical protein